MSTPEPPYLSKLRALTQRLVRGEVSHFEVLHDDGCAMLKGLRFCDCDPLVRAALPGKYLP